MTIKFVCGGCGKHLKARDDMARQRAVCPRCGSMVGIPSLQPTIAGGAAPMTPQERLRAARERRSNPASASEQIQTEPTPSTPLPKPRRVSLLSNHQAKARERSGRRLEKNWQECLIYPMLAWRLCLTLALLMTALSVGIAVVVPRIVLIPDATTDESQITLYLSGALLAFILAGLPCTFLDRVLISAAGGEVDYVLWSGNVVTTFLGALARWTWCALMGPGLLAIVAWLYWLNCGETSWIDGFILAELGIVAVSFQILALASSADRGRWRDANPVAVADFTHRLGSRGLAIVAGSLAFLILGLLIFAGITEARRGMLKGWLMITTGWFGIIFVGTFFARLLGVWCFRTRPLSS